MVAPLAVDLAAVRQARLHGSVENMVTCSRDRCGDAANGRHRGSRAVFLGDWKMTGNLAAHGSCPCQIWCGEHQVAQASRSVPVGLENGEPASVGPMPRGEVICPVLGVKTRKQKAGGVKRGCSVPSCATGPGPGLAPCSPRPAGVLPACAAAPGDGGWAAGRRLGRSGDERPARPIPPSTTGARRKPGNPCS